MNSQKYIKFILPITIILVILASIFITNPNTPQKTLEAQSPKNPVPNQIQVLGVGDKKSENAPTETEIKQIPIFKTQILYGLINSYREENSLPKLFVHKSLEESATRKVEDMVNRKYFRHEDDNNNESWYLFQASGYQYTFAGENLSSGNNTPWQVFASWQNSPKHNEQILKSEYLDMGLSVDCDTYKTTKKTSCIVVLHLGAK